MAPQQEYIDAVSLGLFCCTVRERLFKRPIDMQPLIDFRDSLKHALGEEPFRHGLAFTNYMSEKILYEVSEKQQLPKKIESIQRILDQNPNEQDLSDLNNFLSGLSRKASLYIQFPQTGIPLGITKILD